ncbi:hypothetical protein LZ32DRAFT_393375 [Colletotrichum eremochloae]|nr:hypothetical protein LZ32DRAFT_393375 [Colletotrichum eremochloae]
MRAQGMVSKSCLSQAAAAAAGTTTVMKKETGRFSGRPGHCLDSDRDARRNAIPGSAFPRVGRTDCRMDIRETAAIRDKGGSTLFVTCSFGTDRNRCLNSTQHQSGLFSEMDLFIGL